MPKSKDTGGGGTEADGSMSSQYCSHCYQGGTFTNPDLTAADMILLVRGKMENEMHLPKFVAWWLTRNIPSLGRWRKAG